MGVSTLRAMRIAVLPFNAGPNSRPELARQFANYMVEIARNHTDAQMDAASYMAQMEQNGIPRFLQVNPSEALNDAEMLAQFRGQAEFDVLVDGLLTESESGGGTLTVRGWRGAMAAPDVVEEFPYLPGGMFGALRGAIEWLLGQVGSALPAELGEDEALFGTTDAEAFGKFLMGYDALRFLEQSQGNIAEGWELKPYMERLMEAVEADRDWEAPFLVLVQVCRVAAQFRVGRAEDLLEALKKLTEMEPEDSRAWFALGEFYEVVGSAQGANDAFEKAAQLEPSEPAILHRLARAQLGLGMPVNAERNLRKAIEMEGEDKPSLDLLSDVLAQTGRVHEVPELWNDVLRVNGQNAKAHARYAMALIANGRKEDGERAFDNALEVLEDNTLVKRYYAPYLAQQSDDMDRAMDFYEDCIDVAPNDVPLLWEYAQTLAKAGRDFEVPDILKQLLGSNPDLNLRANAQAWLIEIEEPKRAEAVRDASMKAEAGDFAGAVKDLRPLRQWLADYWKLWLVLATAGNALGEHQEAEQAARRCLELFPACEPAYVELNNALAGQERNDEAYALMQVALGNMPSSLPIALSFAGAAKRVGRTDEARGITGQIREAMKQQKASGEGLEDLERALDEIEK